MTDVLVTTARVTIWKQIGFVPIALFIGPDLDTTLDMQSVLVYALVVASGYAFFMIVGQLLGLPLP